jgi:hypothetical protein
LISSPLILSAETVFRVRSMLATALTWSRPLLLRLDCILSSVRTDDTIEFDVRDGPQLQRLVRDCMLAIAHNSAVQQPTAMPDNQLLGRVPFIWPMNAVTIDSWSPSKV